ncbi:hydrolase [Lithospermum erythrorhizon]|uniref:Hydrolase n=1 Tax=Lithospermum erythrorhizon TaxID=34254 RepID=A0AAV3P9W5_LITER
MDAIVHKYIERNGLKLHIAECGNGPSTVVFLHGFPEIWYSWRHQMMAVANAGFKVIAPDFRGYGLSDPSPQPDKATFLDLVNDLVAILDALGLSKIFLISHDFGARPACQFTMLHPERVMGLVTLGMPYIPGPRSAFLKGLPEGLYISRWQEPGRAEADFSRFDVKTILRNIYILFSRSELPIASENQEIMDVVDESATLPPWFTEEDLDTYADLYKNFGFHSALKVPYRSLNEEFKIQNPRIELPTLIIMGEKDYSLKFPGVEDTLMSGKIKAFVPNLEMTIIPEGSHFVHEQFPDEVNNLIITFLRSQHL